LPLSELSSHVKIPVAIGYKVYKKCRFN